MRWPFARKKRTEDTGASLQRSIGWNASLEYPALENSAFWACVVNLCRTFATLPMHVYEETPQGRKPAGSSALAYILANPCPYLNSYQWRFIMAFNFEIHGQAMAIIERTAGTVTALYPVSPNAMTPRWSDAGDLFFLYGGTGETFRADDVLILSNLTTGFTSALSPLSYAGRDLSVAKASKDLQDSFFSRGTTIGGIVSVPNGTTPEVKKQLTTMFNEAFAGTGNGHKTAVLEQSIKYEPIKLEGKDSNFMVEAQRWTIQEVARRFGVPASFIGDMTQATYSNQEQSARQLVTYGLQPRAVAWEQGLQKLCRKRQTIKFNFNAMLRGDSQAQSAFIHSMVLDGVYSINDALAYLDMPPIEGGDVHLVPANYIPLEMVGQNYQNESVKRESIIPSAPLMDRKERDRIFMEAVRTATKSSRARLEKGIRKQLKAQVDKVMGLAKNEDISSIVASFREWSDNMQAEWGQDYVPTITEIMTRLYPLVQKQVGTKAEVDRNSMEAYAAKYAVSMAGRLANARVTDLELRMEKSSNEDKEDDIEDMADGWIESVPSTESKEETQRAGNAFNLFLYQGLGVEYMHIVASSDSCEFCQGLDGQVCEVNGVVLDKGASVTDGEGNRRVIKKNMKHPPWHRGCTCGIAPGR